MNARGKSAVGSVLQLSGTEGAGDGVKQDIDATLNRTRLLFPVESLASLDVTDAQSAQRSLRHGATFGVWESPREWIPDGVRDGTLTIDLRARIVNFLPERLKNQQPRLVLDSAVLTLTRYLCLLRMGPSGTGKHSFRPLKPNFLRNIAYSYGPALMACGIAKMASNAPDELESLASWTIDSGGAATLFAGLEMSGLDILTTKSRPEVLKECRRMQKLGGLGLWADVPPLDGQSLADAMAGPARHNEAPPKRDSHLPLPDEYLAQMGSRSLWLMRDLGPNLLAIGQSLLAVWERTDRPDHVPGTVRDARSNTVREVLAGHDWRDHEGHRIDVPPFPLRLPKPKGFGQRAVGSAGDDDKRWPPQGYTDFLGLLGALQAAHLFIGFLSMGARQSEVLSLKRDCVATAVDGRPYANGKTFKLVQRHDGEWRDWLLPDVAADAFEQQVRLVAIGEVLGTLKPARRVVKRSPATGSAGAAHLWAQISSAHSASDSSLPLRNINKALISYAQAIGMEMAPGGQLLRSHRFRKTLARLVALALTQAPKLLMDIFGHKSIEMTLYYILTDKDLRLEIEAVSRELRVMRAKEVVEKMVESDLAIQEGRDANLGGYGGLGAVAIHSAVEAHRKRVHRQGTDWGAANALELAELLTLQGKSWEQVRGGVMCTKLPGEAGPCNKSRGRPEPSKCQSSCGHRLEEAFLRDDVDGAILESLAAYDQAMSDDETLTSSHWAAQIRAHVPRFPDLRKKWMLNATVRELMGEGMAAA